MKSIAQTLRSAVALGLLASVGLVSGCGQSAPTTAETPKASTATNAITTEQMPLASFGIINAKLRTPMAGRPSAGYLSIENSGPKADRLVSISSPDFARVEMHDTLSEGGMKKMVKLDGVDIAAGSTLEFTPGGKHLMLFEPTKQLKNGDSVKMTLTFAQLGPMEANFVVLDEIPRAGSGMEEMDHSKMDHSKMDHGSMDHGAMGHGDKKP
ncbi:copper chaperone PCu(A)C [Aquidulcibacter sp.]|uniref:copper chaperone PCu(A)C n=1 Tax=Aquidulcibacter sp. TaxID=2052990 RepID=UPI0025C645AB|nr:copper chaperone PCu(A)C [Aquidulcibacter sp.]MCA3692634.1 copper chaperone PCu(A)C [Aquidulcibacter sp.]